MNVVITIVKWLNMLMTRVPFTIIALFLFLLNDCGWLVIFYSITADICLNAFFLMWEISRHTKEMKEKINPLLLESEIIDDEIIKTMKIEREKYDPFYFRNIKKHNVEAGVVVLKYTGEKLLKGPNTLPFSYGTSHIIMPSYFDTSDFKCITELAHEMGHTIHSFLKQEYLIVPVSLSIFYCFLWLILILNFSPLLLFITILYTLFSVIVWGGNDVKYESLTESNADLLALQTIEQLSGVEKMREAAQNISKKHINLIRNSFISQKRYVHLICLQAIAKCVLEEDRAKLMEKSLKESDSIRMNNCIKNKNRLLGWEMNIRCALSTANTARSAFHCSMYDFNAIQFVTMLSMLLCIALYLPHCSIMCFVNTTNIITPFIVFTITIFCLISIFSYLWLKDLKSTI